MFMKKQRREFFFSSVFKSMSPPRAIVAFHHRKFEGCNSFVENMYLELEGDAV